LAIPNLVMHKQETVNRLYLANVPCDVLSTMLFHHIPIQKIPSGQKEEMESIETLQNYNKSKCLILLYGTTTMVASPPLLRTAPLSIQKGRDSFIQI
jgi:hypothetical protein